MRRLVLFGTAVVLVLGWALDVAGGEIHQAIAEGDGDRVAELLKQDPTLVNRPDETDQFSSLPLHIAAMNGNVDVARVLLKAGAEVDCGDSDESTPLHVAALRRHPEMVAFLLQNGADVNRRDKNGAYSLSFAASGGDSAVVEMVLDAGADLNYFHSAGFTLYHLACSRNLTRLFDRLVERGDDINAAADGGVTPLHWAMRSATPAMVRAMLANGADASAKDEYGTTPLINAAWEGNVEVGKLLLEAGAHPDSADQNGWTAMFPAVQGGHADFVRLLIEYGAEVNHATDQGETPMVRAVTSGDPDVLEALVAAGAATDVCESHFGRSVLHLAALRGYKDLAEQLLDAGAPMNAVDGAENTPLDLGSRYGHKDVVDLLVSRGAAGDKRLGEGTLESQGRIGEGEAVIWYLGHSGWAIKTRDNLLVFDWWQRDRLPDQPGLCNGNIRTSELAGENVTVFVSHEHSDHFDPRIFEWRDGIPGITYVMGCNAQDAPPYEFVGSRQDRIINGMRVRTIESNDTGVGFLIEVDGVVIYHAGDHANRLRDFSGPYCAEIDYLAGLGLRPDIAFMPISGCGFGDQEAVKMGVHYALETLEPRVFIPMHAGGGEYRYRDFISDCRDKFPNVQMEAAENKGDRYRYHDGRIS